MKMMRKFGLYLTLITAASALVWAGTNLPAGVSPEVHKYLPYEVGQWRQFDRSYWSMEYGAAWVEEITQTVLSMDKVLGGSPAYILKDEGVSYDSIWVVFVGDEVRRYEDPPLDYRDYKVILKAPVVKGKQWDFNLFPPQGSKRIAQAKIVDTNVKIKNYDMEFDGCVHVFAEPYYHYYLKPGLGIVRFSSAEKDSVSGTDDELLNWSEEE